MSSGIITKQYGYVNRRSIRLKDYDYARNGAYFITICAHNREYIFCDAVGAGSKPALINTISKPAPLNKLNEFGNIVEQVWFDLPNHNRYIELDEFVVMPNHVHGIIVITDDRQDIEIEQTDILNNRAEIFNKDFRAGSLNNRAGLEPAPTSKNKHPLSEIVRQFKTFSAKRINAKKNHHGKPVWQRNYYEHIIRNEIELNAIREYIAGNPARWNEDENNPDVFKKKRKI